MSYLGITVGSFLGIFAVYFLSDKISASMTKKHGVKLPEVSVIDLAELTASTD